MALSWIQADSRLPRKFPTMPDAKPEILHAGRHLRLCQRGRWEYAEAMPRLPLLGTGLAPLLQWLLIPPLVIWLVRRQIP